MLKERTISIEESSPLKGDVVVSGSKNSVLACLAAAALVIDGSEVVLTNVPEISDIDIMIQILEGMGKKIYRDKNMVTISGQITSTEIDQNKASKIRASIYCLGLSLATLSYAEIPLPGGDKIGDRQIDIHLDSFGELGVDYVLNEGIVRATYSAPNVVRDEVFLRYPSVGATCNLMLLGSRLNKVVIRNAAREPEIVDLANLLIKMGIRVIGAGSDTISIYGAVPHGNLEHEIIPDRIETGMLAVAMSITKGEGIIHGCIPEHNFALMSTLSKAGVALEVNDSRLIVRGGKKYSGVSLSAMPYPGFPTDLQPLMASFAVVCSNESKISDLVFPERFGYVGELRRLGAKIYHEGNSIRVLGESNLHGMHVEGQDIRGVAALICAGLIAKNTTVVSGIDHLERGYEDIVNKLNSLGAQIFYLSK